MQRDLRGIPEYLEAESIYRQLWQPGTDQISDAAELHARSDGGAGLFSGFIVNDLESYRSSRICSVDFASGETRVITFGPHTDRLPKYAPDGRMIAFLSDRHRRGDFQLYLLNPTSGVTRATPRPQGWIEHFHWSPDSDRIVLGVAGYGADVAGAHGAIASRTQTDDMPSWIPELKVGNEEYRWRTAWVYDLITGRLRQVSPTGLNVWDAVWCGDGLISAITSDDCEEGSWYSARLVLLDMDGQSREIYRPQLQVGCPAASPYGSRLAFVEGLCSDRCIVAGSLRLLDLRSGACTQVETGGVDITHTEWRSDRYLLLAGHRRFESVVGLYDTTVGKFAELWASEERTTGSRYISVSGFGEAGYFALVGESFQQAPEIALVRDGKYVAVRSFDLMRDGKEEDCDVRRVTWRAPDDTEIDGWLLRPCAAGPHPMVMNIHGGPVGHWRQTWLGRTGIPSLLLIRHGYAVFYPNPRGSIGRGEMFARQVLGDMAGADTEDFLSGIDYLVDERVVDDTRLGVMGASYGGFMTCWLTAHDSRFAAAVSIVPMINCVTQHLLSNIPQFMSLFLADHYSNRGGKYFDRSPIMHAHRVRTPTLNICGALDRSAPPEEALQFHNALRENGVESVLVTYPEEGHGVRKLPAGIDYAARILMWFDQHMPAKSG